MTRRLAAATILWLAAGFPSVADDEAPAFEQTDRDAYTRYELLDPAGASFRILYDISATTPGARLYFNPVRVGSEPTVHAVTDLATGKPLEWNLVAAEAAIAEGLRTSHPGRFIRVSLARPVPQRHGQGRIRIDKTYRDPESYFAEGDDLVFERTLGVERNAVVLPHGYELIGCNYPSQIDLEADGRLRVSFMNRGPAPVPLRLVMRQLPPRRARPEATDRGALEPRDPVLQSVPSGARTDFQASERAFENRDIVYFLEQPETHSFRLYHDYTETRPGVDRYLNVVRPGSRATDPSAIALDTGESLEVETLRGAEIAQRGIDIGEAPGEHTEVVAIWFDPVEAGASLRIRIEETYTDPGRYGLDGDELLWDRSFGRARNTVLLPPGWYLTRSVVPAVVDRADTGEIRLYFENDRPGVIEVLLRARRR